MPARRRRRITARGRLLSAAALALGLVAGCEAGPPPPTPPIVPGSSAAPREINVVMKDWLFLPDPIDIVPGEIVLLHVVNGGLVVHEMVVGDQRVQDAWEAAEAAAADPPPGPTPLVTVSPEVGGIRVVVESGKRVDVAWTVPPDLAVVGSLVLGCHIPGHWAQGMKAGIRLVSVLLPGA
ncbi:MAG: hypothetical protein ABIZ72_10710 [Candidatus Limnocylindrales bacterium]